MPRVSNHNRKHFRRYCETNNVSHTQKKIHWIDISCVIKISKPIQADAKLYNNTTYLIIWAHYIFAL